MKAARRRFRTVLLAALAVGLLGGPAVAQVVTPHVESTNALGTNYFLGKTGIGTNAPGEMLHVVGDSRMQGGLQVDGAFRIPQQGDLGMGVFTNGVSDQGIVASNLALHGAWVSYNGASEGLTVDAAGHVGVGTATPETLFHVAGTGQVNHLNVEDGFTLAGETWTSLPAHIEEGAFAAVSNDAGTAFIAASYASNAVGGDVVVLTNGQDLAAAYNANTRSNVTFLLPYGTVTMGSSVYVMDGVNLIGRGMDRSTVTGSGRWAFLNGSGKVATNYVRGLTWKAAGNVLSIYNSKGTNVAFVEDVRTYSVGTAGNAMQTQPIGYYTFRECAIENATAFINSTSSTTNFCTLVDTRVGSTHYTYGLYRNKPVSWTPEPVITNIFRASEVNVDNVLKMQAASTNPPGYTGGVQLWAQASASTNELFVMDSGGNITQLSTHEGLRHVARSWNLFTGKGRVIDLDALAEAVEELTGRSDIVRALSYPRVTWESLEQAKVDARNAEILEWQRLAAEGQLPGDAPAPEPYIPAPKPDWLVEWEKADPASEAP